MTDRKNEILSAFIDEELTVQEQCRLADDISDDAVLRDKAKRYSLIGEAMRGNTASLNFIDVADSVKKAVAEEPTVLAPKQLQKPKSILPKAVWGGAIAASVALVSLFVVLPGVQTDSDTGVPDFANAPVSKMEGVQQVASTKKQNWKSAAELKNEKLNRYLMEHNEMAAHTGLNGQAAQVNFVSHSGNY